MKTEEQIDAAIDAYTAALSDDETHARAVLLARPGVWVSREAAICPRCKKPYVVGDLVIGPPDATSRPHADPRVCR